METEVDVPNANLILVPGMYAEVDLTIDHRADDTGHSDYSGRSGPRDAGRFEDGHESWWSPLIIASSRAT